MATRKPDLKYAAKMIGAAFFMGMGALIVGSAYVMVVEHLTNEPINK